MKIINNIIISWKIVAALLKLLWAARDEDPNRAKVRRIIKAINCHERALRTKEK